MSTDLRYDPHDGTPVHVVASRQGRPNLPDDSCPFCVGGREALEPYDVTWFTNRWPAMPDKRCEVVLYTSDHDASLATLGADGIARVIDLWAERTTTLGSRDDVNYVLVFENRGPEVGATIAHPHGQIYAYDHVPPRPARRLARWTPDTDPGDRHVVTVGEWSAVVPHAPVYPVALDIAPTTHIADLASCSTDQRAALAVLLTDVMDRLDRLFDQPLPYMMWLNQRPTTTHGWDDAWLSIEIVSPWRSAGVTRYMAAAEVAAEEYFNPVDPAELAGRLRALARGPQ